MNLKYQLLQAGTLPNGKVRGRYAPSPSGVQHLGNIQTAILSWLQVRLAGGEFALRMDDIDTPRIRAGSAEQIIDDLRWLGLDWDVLTGIEYEPSEEELYLESDYLPFYEAAFECLKSKGLLYPCACSRRDIRKAVSAPNAAGHYVYPGTCRELDVDSFGQDASLLWRFIVPNYEIEFTDMLIGHYSQNTAHAWGDIIVRRRGGLFAYQLVSVVDDIHMGVSDVVRGEDLLEQTPGQIALFRALDAELPRFWHVPVKTDSEGNKLAKRDGSDSLQNLRTAGKRAEEVIAELAFELELIDCPEPLSLEELLAHMRLAK